MTLKDSDAADKSTQPYDKVAVLGAGAWGTALAIVAHEAGRDVALWGRSAPTVDEINTRHTSERFLPGVSLPEGLKADTDLARTVGGADVVLIVTPSNTLRKLARDIRPDLQPGVPIVLCAKGIEVDTGLLLNEVAVEELPGHPIGALSGPTFARETAMGHPTAATIAFPFAYKDRIHPQASPAARMALSLGTSAFRPYISDDLVGVEVAGAVKNVIAIACGIVTGAGFAENTRAALITRGMDEMKTLAEALGGRRETVTGLSGAGDLTLTCSSTTSRNMSLGVQLGQGLARKDCFEGRPVVVEGELNAKSVRHLAQRIGVSLPICEAVYAVLHENADLAQTFSNLWARPLKAEPKGMSLELDNPVQSTPFEGD